jgi:hypothetical protein
LKKSESDCRRLFVCLRQETNDQFWIQPVSKPLHTNIHSENTRKFNVILDIESTHTVYENSCANDIYTKKN